MKFNLMAYIFVGIVAFTAVFHPKTDRVVSSNVQVASAVEVKEDPKDKLNIFLKSLNPLECFRFSYTIVSNHRWEVSHVHRTHTYMLVDKDNTGILIIQPREEECDDAEIEVCDKLWLRTVDFDDNWLPYHLPVEKVKCPALYNKALLKELDRIEPMYKIDIE